MRHVDVEVETVLVVYDDAAGRPLAVVAEELCALGAPLGGAQGLRAPRLGLVSRREAQEAQRRPCERDAQVALVRLTCAGRRLDQQAFAFFSPPGQVNFRR